jgi:Polyketide cyclase / dehydrase and lipid transport
MKDLDGAATAAVWAPLDECLAVLEAVDRYPTWYPQVVRDVEVLERDPRGQPSRVRTKLHVSRGPVVKDFDLILVVAVESNAVKLTRPPDNPSPQQFDVAWQLRDGGETTIELHLHAKLNVRRFMPLGGVGNALAQGFVAAAKSAIESQRADRRTE